MVTVPLFLYGVLPLYYSIGAFRDGSAGHDLGGLAAWQRDFRSDCACRKD